MGEMLQESEKYILQWWDLDDNKRGFQTCMDYEDAVQRIKQYKQNDTIYDYESAKAYIEYSACRDKYRILKREVTEWEVVE